MNIFMAEKAINEKFNMLTLISLKPPSPTIIKIWVKTIHSI